MEIGSLLGKVEQIDLDESNDQYGCSLRVKILIDVQMPLKRGIFLRKGEGNAEKWIMVRYEKLPDFCYGYGLLGHTIKECGNTGEGKEEELPYGSWMREPVKIKIRDNIYPFRASFFQSRRGRGSFGEDTRGS